MCQHYGALHKCIGAMHKSRFKSPKLETIYRSHKRCMNDETSEQDDEPDQQLPQLAPLPRDRERVEPPFQPRAQRSWYLPQRHSLCSTEVLFLRIQSFVGFLLLPNPTDATDHLLLLPGRSAKTTLAGSSSPSECCFFALPSAIFLAQTTAQPYDAPWPPGAFRCICRRFLLFPCV